MSALPVLLGPTLFQFNSFSGWCNHAQYAWKEISVRADDTLCIDSKGRICSIGRDFMKARDEEAFPITVHLKRGDLPQYERFNAAPMPDRAPESERDTLTVDMFGASL